jgi:RNA polymerase sigma factor (sigma-70 family)
MPAKVLFALSPIGYDAPEETRPSRWRASLFEAVCRLPERLAQVVTLRYYGRNGEPWTLTQIGQLFGVSDERVRQLLRDAYRRLQQSCQELDPEE